MFASDSTCCVCRERGKAVQVHHVDEDPSNNTFANLAVLCLECHNHTQVSGGFRRKRNAAWVMKNSDESLARGIQRRDADDRAAIDKKVATRGCWAKASGGTLASSHERACSDT